MGFRFQSAGNVANVEGSKILGVEGVYGFCA